MWRIILVMIFPYIIGVVVRPLDPVEMPIWEERISEAIYPVEAISSTNSDPLKHRYPYDNYEITDAETDYLARPSSKRALAMFARWGSINGIGKNRPPIRSNVFDAEDSISAQTRGRMLGQPLRWG